MNIKMKYYLRPYYNYEDYIHIYEAFYRVSMLMLQFYALYGQR